MQAIWNGNDEREAYLAKAGLLVAMAIAAGLLIWEGRGQTLLIDDWSFGYGSRTNLDLSAFFMPHNGHLVAVPVLIMKVSLQVFGAASTLPLRLFSVGVHLATVACLYFLLRSVLTPIAALAPAVLVLFLGAANDVLLGPHGLPITLSVATGLGAWLALRQRTLSWDGTAAILLTIGICSSGSALPFTIGAIAIIALDSESPRARLWVSAIPLGVYAIWWLIEGRAEGQFEMANLGGLPSFAFDSLAAGLGSITGLFTTPGSRSGAFDLSAGQALAGGCLVACLALVLRGRYRLSSTTMPPLIALLFFWLLTALTAGPDRQPDSSRYLYVGVILLLLVLAQLIATSSVRRDGAIALAAICTFALLPNIRELTYGADFFRTQSEQNRAVLGAADLVAGQGGGDIPVEIQEDLAKGDVPDLNFSLEQYLASERRFGGPAFSVAQIRHAEPGARSSADRLIARALPIDVHPASSSSHPLQGRAGVSQAGGVLTRRGGCLHFIPLAFGAQVSLKLPMGGLWVRPDLGSPVPVGLKRFADEFETVVGPVVGGRASTFGLPPGPASRDWLVQLTPEEPILLCGA